jgi:hypothetical protein
LVYTWREMFFILKLKPTNDTQYANLLRLIHRVVGKLCMYNEGEKSRHFCFNP